MGSRAVVEAQYRDDRGTVVISSDRGRVDGEFVFAYMHEHMYWAKSLTLEAFRRALQYSALVFGVYADGKQIGFARVISDCATFAYLTDVFIVAEHRGRGLSKQLLTSIVAHPQLQGLRRFVLVTEDAEGLYAKFGFTRMADADHWMQIFRE
ncbi:GNAT family N-acetyltransferase [Paenibacillus athensensis]|uniref:N-acetyltransferase domain-containing protein n=2 Tax=Paenibacillus athensensis TaxID=1967502 RepID=A0A4Y8Q7S8_9BACL|nr:GNAT family N-acetyltransferase [Paenibacillus athensensis]